MVGRVVEIDFGMTIVAGDVDIFRIVPVVSATTGRRTVTDVTTRRD